jgi:hypothetical protein
MAWRIKPWQRIVLACAASQASFLMLYVAAAPLAGHIHALVLEMLGRPYLFSSVDLRPYLLTIFLIASTPSALLGLLVYRRAGSGPLQFQLRSLMLVIAAIAVLLMLFDRQNEPASMAFGKAKVLGFFACTITLSCALFRSLVKADAEIN